jgi:hypothetical protein
MNKDEVRSIIESTLKSGSMTPGLFDLPKIIGVKSKLESCTTINEVIGVLQAHRELVCKSFGLEQVPFDEALGKIKAL